MGVLGCSGKRSSVVTDKGGHRGGCWLLGPVLSDVSRWETLDERRNKTNLRPGCPIGYQSCTPLVSQRSREQTGQGRARPGMAWQWPHKEGGPPKRSVRGLWTVSLRERIEWHSMMRFGKAK